MAGAFLLLLFNVLGASPVTPGPEEVGGVWHAPETGRTWHA